MNTQPTMTQGGAMPKPHRLSHFSFLALLHGSRGNNSLISIFTFISMLLASVAFADEPTMPDFVSPPQRYEYQHQVTRVGSESPDIVVDELLIGDVTDNQLKFYFYIIGANGHICGGSGTATLRNGAYYYNTPSVKEIYEKGKLRKEPVECRLRITFDSTSASLLDEGGNCKQTHCGLRAYIGDVRLKRAD